MASAARPTLSPTVRSSANAVAALRARDCSRSKALYADPLLQALLGEELRGLQPLISKLEALPHNTSPESPGDQRTSFVGLRAKFLNDGISVRTSTGWGSRGSSPCPCCIAAPSHHLPTFSRTQWLSKLRLASASDHNCRSVGLTAASDTHTLPKHVIDACLPL